MQITLDITDELIEALANALAIKLGYSIKAEEKVASFKWLTHAEAAAYIRKTPAALYKLTCERKLKFSKRGKQNLYLTEHLDAFLKEGEVKTIDEIKNELTLIPKKYSITK